MLTGWAGWRSIAATWGGAMLLLMRQFGTPSPTAVMTETRVVRVAEADAEHAGSELTPDGRILTLPVELRAQRERQGTSPVSGHQFTAN